MLNRKIDQQKIVDHGKRQYRRIQKRNQKKSRRSQCPRESHNFLLPPAQICRQTAFLRSKVATSLADASHRTGPAPLLILELVTRHSSLPHCEANHSACLFAIIVEGLTGDLWGLLQAYCANAARSKWFMNTCINAVRCRFGSRGISPITRTCPKRSIVSRFSRF